MGLREDVEVVASIASVVSVGSGASVDSVVETDSTVSKLAEEVDVTSANEMVVVVP